MGSWDLRTDYDRTIELLELVECKHLDFKETLNLDKNSKGLLEFAKDVAAMANSHPGGHIVVGITNESRTPCAKKGTFGISEYDSANLFGKIKKYISGVVNIASQVHQIKDTDKEVLVIAISSPSDGLPVIMSQDGIYNHKSGGRCSAFHKGTIYTRESSSNVLIDHKHWGDILQNHNDLIEKRVRKNISYMLADIKRETDLRGTEEVLSPLDFSLDVETIVKSIENHISKRRITDIVNFVARACNRVRSYGDIAIDNHELIQIMIAACSSLKHAQLELFEEIIHLLKSLYDDRKDNGAFSLALSVNLYVLGSYVVRMEQWSVLRNLILQQTHCGSDYRYNSWIRYSQVQASRSGLLQPNESLISHARALMKTYSCLRPDISEITNNDTSNKSDVALDSLCCFDFLQMIIQLDYSAQAEESKGDAEPYCSAVYFAEARIAGIVNRLSDNKELQNVILSTSDKNQIMALIKETYDLCRECANSHGVFWAPFNALRHMPLA